MKYASLMRSLGLLMALGIALFVGCKKEKEQNGPSLTVAGDPGVVTGDRTSPPGTHSFRFKLIAQKGSGKDDADLKEYTITGTNNIVNVRRPAPNGQNFTIDTTMEITGANNQSYTITFTVTDKNDKSVSRKFTITFRDTTPPPPPGIVDSLYSTNYTNQNDGKGTYLRYQPASGSFSLLDRNSANSYASEILFVYYYSGGTLKHSVISPGVMGDQNYGSLQWTVSGRNETLFREAPSGTNFTSATHQQIKDAYEGGTELDEFDPDPNQPGNLNKEKRAECTIGRLIAFKQGNIYGLIRVEGVNSNNASATLSVKIARP